jgi:hypothetical protein
MLDLNELNILKYFFLYIVECADKSHKLSMEIKLIKPWKSVF